MIVKSIVYAHKITRSSSYVQLYIFFTFHAPIFSLPTSNWHYSLSYRSYKTHARIFAHMEMYTKKKISQYFLLIVEFSQTPPVSAEQRYAREFPSFPDSLPLVL
uniref:Uncharacterized protein n=1 Tax=Anopheles albimanus TaxID=7167 RepID=A0A182FX95_ANOAL